MMDLSLNEVETLAAKAARGAGCSWGEADEMGRAARWLAHSGLAFAPTLIAFLEARGTLARPRAVDGQLEAPGPACPLATGCWLVDGAGAWTMVDLPDVAFPLLLLPFAARAAHLAGRPLRFTSREGAWTLTALGELSGDEPGGVRSEGQSRVACTGDVPSPARPVHRRAAMEAADLRVLQTYALNTCVPESEGSRSRGAGGGGTDDD
ncbi:DUF3726 domain-containing protein [Ancylobacter amanitiformis]|uniref:DUF3726 domain-containing protein n=1 Tax=Ancylobacter amanitiformis TaxID=217069 RepID=A0ABU0LV77_9HYPH|nr:DUF3726 domain-containing protein [Ancylobacter amanitiformis]MDQ0512629.1 hypothetical protein [Ancylobacter amanitiformis]